MKEPIELLFVTGEPAEAAAMTARSLGFEAAIQVRRLAHQEEPVGYVVHVTQPKLTPEEAQRIHQLDQGTAGMETLGAGTAAFYKGALEHSDAATARVATWLYIRGLLGKPPEGA